jgi:hypothetical protein
LAVLLLLHRQFRKLALKTKSGAHNLYALDNLVLELNSEGPKREEVDRLLLELSWAKTRSSGQRPTLHLCVNSNNSGFKIPPNCREVLRADGFVGLETGDEFYLTDGSSVFHLLPSKGEGYARLAPFFSLKPKLTQGNFWCFGLLKLLRPLGIYSLHAAGLATIDGAGLLLVGPPGSGKSTLAIGLIREGWRYLSDDALLLRDGSQRIEARGCRRSFYIDAVRSPEYSDLSLGNDTPDSNGRQRRRVGIDEVFREQYVRRCVPRIVIFPQIKSQDDSTVKAIDSVRALRFLLTQSAPQLFDRSTMTAHLELLNRLLRQTETYELNAGIDLYHEPAKLIQLIRKARGGSHWPALSLS